jgi:hypothetical protein
VAVLGAAPLVLLHEPILAAVLVGAVPTGYSAIRPVTGPVVADRLQVWPTPFGARVRPASSCTLTDGWAALPAFARAGVDGVGLAVGILDLICCTLDSATALVEGLCERAGHLLHCGSIWRSGPSVDDHGQWIGLTSARLNDYVRDRWIASRGVV